MRVRRATPADANRAVELLRDSHVAAGFDRADGPSGFVVPFVEAYAMRLFLAHVTTPNMFALIRESAGVDGVLLAAASEHPFGPVMIARETVWWIDPARRGHGGAALQMLTAYELWAESIGCAFAGMAGMGEDPDVAQLYLRRGYRPAEKHFLKAL
ncbi:GCN5 family acetyltransferase [Bradyrhizobium sp. 31Argb]|uniref:GNAT family N-acetyltransferase n=1 Tax=Bradyrhizobium sp. 31Argb TaxID=3141247 RepID=UPI0037490DE5